MYNVTCHMLFKNEICKFSSLHNSRMKNYPQSNHLWTKHSAANLMRKYNSKVCFEIRTGNGVGIKIHVFLNFTYLSLEMFNF